MLVTLTHTARATADVDASVRWQSSASRQTGEAEIVLPRSSPLWDPAYVDEEGGFLVEIVDDQLGSWRGVALTPDFTDTGLRCKALELGALCGHRVVGMNRVFEYCTAGQIARRGFKDALGGLGVLGFAEGTFAEAAPVIPRYEFRGQTFFQVLKELSERTGQEWELSASGVFSWLPATGSLYGLSLADGSGVVEVSREASVSETATEVIARGSTGQSYTARNTGRDTGYWRRQVPVQVDAASMVRVGVEAEQRLDDLRLPRTTYKGRLHRDHWAIREGDYARLVLPRSGVQGETVTVRFTSRSYRDGDNWVTWEASPARDFVAADAISFGAARAEYGVIVPYREDIARLIAKVLSGVYNLETRTVS